MEYIYRHPNPGYVLTLFDKDGKEVTNPKTGRHTAIFQDTGRGNDRCGVYRTHEKIVADAVESSKAFKAKTIIRIKTPEELELESLKEKRLENRKHVISLGKSGLFDMESLEKKNKEQMLEFVESIGFEGMEKNTKAELLDVVKELFEEGEKTDE